MFILAYDDNGVSRRHTLPEGDMFVGRGQQCHIRVADDSVSRVHAQISVSGASCRIIDLGSRNGTYVNGVPIEGTELKDGDQIAFGSNIARFEVSAEDQLALVDEADPTALPIVLNLSVDQAPSRAAIDPTRLLRLISEIVRSLVKQQPLADVLEEVVRLTLEHTLARRTFLVLKDEKTGALVPRVARTRDNLRTSHETISRTILNRVMTERVALLATNVHEDERFGNVESIFASNIGAFMCAPLWNRETTIGALYLDANSNAFSAADLELLTALSHCAAIAIEQARLTSTLNEETRRRERLGRYHSPAVVARILDASVDDMTFIAQDREITVLFADLVGFTTLAESMPPQQVATLLNRFFSRMTDIVFQHDGTLDKFIGDALMAVFGAPLDQPGHAILAVNAARAMRRALAQLNAELKGPPLQMRIALNSGMALAGDIGAPTRREYTVLGDVVNSASRIEATIAGPDQIVIARATYDRIPSDVAVRPLGKVTLRGRREPLEVFELLADSEQSDVK